MFLLAIFVVQMCGWWFLSKDQQNPFDWASLLGISLAVYALFVLLFSRRARIVQADLAATFMAILLGIPAMIVNPVFGLIVVVGTYATIAAKVYRS